MLEQIACNSAISLNVSLNNKQNVKNIFFNNSLKTSGFRQASTPYNSNACPAFSARCCYLRNILRTIYVCSSISKAHFK